MPAERNLALQLIISAKDQASSVLSKLFSFLDSEVSVVAGKIRDAFSGVFGGGLDGAIEFEAQLDKVQAKGGYTAETMAQLKQAAIEIGTQFGLSGTQAAQGMESLAAAGLNATQVMQALPSVLALAKAEALSMDQASALLANSLTTVGLGFDQAARLANVLTQAANESTTSATAVGKALETAGGIARTAGLDLEQTVAVLTALAKSGIEGERAGTALAAILTQLLNPASKASEELNALNITSRDLATVIGELQSKGVNANAAILAFGETAGPGLRALISQGQQGIAELVQALLGADGAAQKAAEGMGGNLKGAMEALESTWENVKSALFDPALESLTKAARDASEALNGSLNDGALKPVQEAIKTFTENGIKFVREFIASFDFTSATAHLNEFAANSETAFVKIGNSASAAADSVKIAWNALTGVLRGVVASVVEIIASGTATLANIEEAASKIGLGTVERANELRQTALNMQDTARFILEDIKTDGNDIQEAYDRLTGATDAAADAQRRLKDSLPVAELQTITKTLADYQGIAQRANDEAERARVSYDAGTVSAAHYGQALLAAAQANAELEAATKAQAAETKDAVDQSNRLANEREGEAKAAAKAAQASGAYADALQASGDAASEVLRAEIELARAKGNTATATAKLQQLAQQEAATAQAVAAAKEAEAQQTQLAYEKQQAYLAAVGGGSEIQKQELELLRLKAVALGEEAKAAAVAAEIKKLAEQQRSSNTKATQENTQATEQHTQATNENSEAQKVNIKHTEGGAAAAKLMNDYLQAARKSTEELSEATRNLFDAELYQAAYRAGFEAYDGYRKAIVAYKNGVDAGKAALTAFQTELDNANTLVKQSELKILSATSAWQRMDAVIELATGKAKKSFYEQAIAAENLAQGLDRAMESTAGFLQQTIDHAEKASQGLHLLDDQDLSRLRAAIDAANDKLRQMQEETQSAKDRLQELNAELADARGEDKKAQELRQQLEFQTDLATIEDQRRKAELTGNTEALRALDEQKKVLEAINKIRIDNIRSPEVAERQRRVQETLDNTPARSSGGGGLATNTFNINVDGRDLLSEDQIRNKIIPVLNRATRLSK